MPNGGHPRVREAVAARLSSATGLPYTASHVLMTVGAGAALNTVLKALLNPGDEVLTVAPFFVECKCYAANYGGQLRPGPPLSHRSPPLPPPRAPLPPRPRAPLPNPPTHP